MVLQDGLVQSETAMWEKEDYFIHDSLFVEGVLMTERRWKMVKTIIWVLPFCFNGRKEEEEEVKI